MSDLEGFEPTDADLRRISELAREQRDREIDVQRCEAALKSASEALRVVSEHQLPEAMIACGVKRYTTQDGLSVRVDEKYRCGQLDDVPDKEDGRPLSERLEALSWIDTKHPDVPKRVVTLTLGADSFDQAIALIRLIRSSPGGNQVMIDHRRLVPWGTLSKLARTLVRDGYDPPLDKLGVVRVNVAKVTREDI